MSDEVCELDFSDDPVPEKVVQFGEFQMSASGTIPHGWVSIGTLSTSANYTLGNTQWHYFTSNSTAGSV